MEFSGTLETNSSWRLPFATMRGAEGKLMVMSDHLGQPDHQGTHEEEGNVLGNDNRSRCQHVFAGSVMSW